MVAYYNEWDPHAAQWLCNLIKNNIIAPGDVDQRSIKDVKADDLKKYTQCHFFAGIGGWSIALRAARWGDDRPIWTGSCPCQPFSCGGRQKGHGDERNLWPHWNGLIGECKPPKIFGEQVDRSITFGWWDKVASDLEAQNYAVASSVLPAYSVGSPHERNRIIFVADPEHNWIQERRGIEAIGFEGKRSPRICGNVRQSGVEQKECLFPTPPLLRNIAFSEKDPWKVEPELGRVVNGFSGRTQQLRAYGNAIVPQVAQAFIEAFMDCQP